MKINAKYTRFQASPDVREYLEKRLKSLEHLVKRYESDGDKTLFVEIALSTKHHRHGNVFYGEAMLELPGKLLRAEHTDSDIRAAIDIMKDNLKREIRRYKEKNLAKNKHSKRSEK